MPEDQGRRRFPRFAVHLPFLYAAEAAPSAIKRVGWTRSLSEGGATVELSERFRPLTPLRLRLQTERVPVEAEAQVIWSGGRALEGGGVIHGVSFSPIDPDVSQTIRDTVRPPAGMRHSGLRLPLDLPVTCHPRNPDGPPLQGRTGNANRGGLFLRLPRLVPTGTVIEVALHASPRPLRLEGTVVWVEPYEIWTPGESIGHGLRFATPDWPTLVSLGFLLVQPA